MPGAHHCLLLLQAKRRESPAEGSHRTSEQDGKQVLATSPAAVICGVLVSTCLPPKLACASVFHSNVQKMLLLPFGNNRSPQHCPHREHGVPFAARLRVSWSCLNRAHHGAASATAPAALEIPKLSSRRGQGRALHLAWRSPLRLALSAISAFHEDAGPHERWLRLH